MVIIYTLTGILINRIMMLIIQDYTLAEERSSSGMDIFRNALCIKRYCWKEFFLGVLNIILWYFIWKLEGLNMYSTFICMLTSFLLTISIIDIKCMIIPDSLIIGIFIMGTFFILFNYISIFHALFGFISGSGLLYIVYVFTKQKGIGGGDIKLMAVSGLFLGVQKSILALEIACILALILQGVIGRIKQNQAFAFGPYLSAGIFLSLLIGDFVISMILLGW